MLEDLKNLTDDQRINVLKLWTESKRGRGVALARVMFPTWTKNSQSVIIPSVKSGKYIFTPEQWEEAFKIMDAIEKTEEPTRPSPVKQPSQKYATNVHIKHIEEFLKIWDNSKEFKKFIGQPSASNESLFTNKTALLNNFEHFQLSKKDPSIKSQHFIVSNWLKTDNKTKIRLANVVYSMNFSETRKDVLNDARFSNSIKSMMTNLEFERIMKVMNKVDQLIESKSPFANAARRAP